MGLVYPPRKGGRVSFAVLLAPFNGVSIVDTRDVCLVKINKIRIEKESFFILVTGNFYFWSLWFYTRRWDRFEIE